MTVYATNMQYKMCEHKAEHQARTHTVVIVRVQENKRCNGMHTDACNSIYWRFVKCRY